MSINKRLVIETLLVTLLFLVGIVVWNVVQGMIMTMNYGSDLAEQHTLIATKSEVELGVTTPWDAVSITIAITGCLVFIVAYYTLRLGIQRRR